MVFSQVYHVVNACEGSFTPLSFVRQVHWIGLLMDGSQFTRTVDLRIVLSCVAASHIASFLP